MDHVEREKVLKTINGLAAVCKDTDIFKELSKYSSDIQITQLCAAAEFSVFRVKYASHSFFLKLYNNEGNEANRLLMSLEIKGLQLHQRLGVVPRLYCSSDEYNSIVLEDLMEFHSLQSEVLASRVDEVAINNLALSLAVIHKEHYGAEKLEQLVKDFGSNPMTAKVHQSLFDDPYDYAKILASHPDSHLQKAVAHMQANEGLPANVSALRVKAGKAECLIHGNLTTANIVVKSGQIKLLGNQYTTVGACAFDVGILVAQYLSFYHIHMLTEEDNDAHRQISYKMVDAATTTIDAYLEHMKAFLVGDAVQEFMSDVAGFCGAELVRIAMTDPSNKKSVEILESGLRLISAMHRIPDSSRLTIIALMLTH